MTNDKNTAESPRGYHDIGGNAAGKIPLEDIPWLHWEKQTEAIRNLLGDGTRRIISLDEMRRGFESFGADKYRSYSFYRRRLEAMIDVLIEKEAITKEELEAAIFEKRKIWKEHTEGTEIA